MVKFRSTLWTLVLCALIAVVPARAQQPLKKTLPNGLTVLVQENRAAPVVSVRVYVKTGSIYEGELQGAGLSHLFEHTLFEGTKTRDKKALNDEIQAIGGQSNAYTSHDVTCYYITTAAPYFDRAVNVLADMARNATFPEAEVKVQQGVIHNEMNLGEDDPDRALSQLFYRTAFKVHPVRLPIIGYKEQFDRLTRQDILNYYSTHYTPQNTILSIAGDVSPDSAFELAAKAFGDWQRQAPRTPVVATEPYQNAPRRAVLEKDVQLGYLQLGWRTIPLQHPDLYALDTLAQVLGGGTSSRLVQEVQEKKNLVSSVAAYSSTPNFDAGVFSVRAATEPANLNAAQAAILVEVDRIKKNGVTQDELQRAKNQIKAAFVFNSQGVDNQAEQIAYDEMGTGDPAYSRRYVNRIQSVTAEEVRDAAIRYLRAEGVTVAIVQPRKAATAAAAKTQQSEVAPPKMVRLSNGVRLVVRPAKTSGTVSIVAMGLGGVRAEAAGKAGVANLTAQMLTRGTQNRTAQELAVKVDELGGSLDGFSGYNAWGVQSRWLAADWRRGLALVTESLLTPTFPDQELQRVKSQTLAALAQQADDPISSASLLLRKTFYGANPYGRNALGTPGTVKSITRADIEAHWKMVFQPGQTVLAVYGDVDAAQVQAASEYLLGGVKAAAAPAPAPPAVVIPDSFRQETESKPGLAQAVLFFGYASINVRDEDRYALDVLDAALSGADLPGGRLHARLRDNELVYVVHALDQPALDRGMFIIYAATTPENLEKVKSIILEEVKGVREADISPEELERAKSMAIAANSISLQTNDAQARTAASDELFGLGYRNSEEYTRRIQAITLADVRRVAQKYLVENQAALGIVAPQK